MSRERQIEVITYEQERLYFFVDQVSLAQKRYDRLFKTFKDAPYLSEGAQFLSDAGRELQFYKDVVEMLDQGYRKQSEGEWQIKSEIYKMIDDVDEEIFVECSICHRRFYVPYELDDEKIFKYARDNYPYCNCGAKMSRKEDEGK